MAKDYLAKKFRLHPFDAAAKAQGAPGLDIDVQTLDGQRVIGEIKTTTPYLPNDFGAQQRSAFEKDFEKLTTTAADHRFLFVTDRTTFGIIRRRYADRLPGVVIVLLTTGDEHQA